MLKPYSLTVAINNLIKISVRSDKLPFLFSVGISFVSPREEKSPSMCFSLFVTVYVKSMDILHQFCPPSIVPHCCRICDTKNFRLIFFVVVVFSFQQMKGRSSKTTSRFYGLIADTFIYPFEIKNLHNNLFAPTKRFKHLNRWIFYSVFVISYSGCVYIVDHSKFCAQL